MGQIIEDKASTCGNKPCLQYEDGPVVTFSQVHETTNRVANGLLDLGLQHGDKVATFLSNCLEDVYLWYALSKNGMVDVPVNLANKGDFLSHVLNTSDAKAIVIHRDLLTRLKFIEDDLPKLKNVIIMSKPGVSVEIPEFKFKVSNYEDLLKGSPANPGIRVKASEPQVIIFTSGTTGPAKGVLSNHYGHYLSSLEYLKAIRAQDDDVFFTCLPLFHGNARMLTLYPAMVNESQVTIYDRFSASKFWDWIRKSGATVFNSLGAMANFIYNQPPRNDDGDNPARVCAAFPMPAAIYKGFQERYKLKVIEGYGLSEMAIITYNPWDSPKIGSCGKAVPLFEVKIVDENDFPLPPGKVGEIVAQGKVPWTMSLGYYGMPDKTVEFMRNHYYHSGDGGYLDEDGYMYFQDRMKDYIRRRGENISSFEVERSVNAHPKVAESAAIAVKSDLSEDEVKIVVVLKEGENLTPEELLDFCQERMPYFAVPRYVEFVINLPKTPTDKIQKNALRDAGLTAATWDREKAGYKVNR